MATVIRNPGNGSSAYLLKGSASRPNTDESLSGSKLDSVPNSRAIVGYNASDKEGFEERQQLMYQQKIEELEKEVTRLNEVISENSASVKEKAFKEGFELGINSGKEQAQAKISQLEGILAGIDDEARRLLENQEDSMVEVVYAAVCKLIGNEFGNKELALENVRRATRQIRILDNLVIRVSARDYELLNENAIFQTGLPDGFRLIEDEQVKLGGCIIETVAGSIDQRLEVQLQILKDTLLSVRKRSQ